MHICDYGNYLLCGQSVVSMLLPFVSCWLLFFLSGLKPKIHACICTYPYCLICCCWFVLFPFFLRFFLSACAPCFSNFNIFIPKEAAPKHVELSSFILCPYRHILDTQYKKEKTRCKYITSLRMTDFHFQITKPCTRSSYERPHELLIRRTRKWVRNRWVIEQERSKLQ